MPIFKPVFIEGTTLGDTWHTLLWELYHKGRKYFITKGSYEGSYRYAFDFVSGVIHFPHERPLSPIMPEGSNLPSPTDEQSIENYFINYLMRKDLEIHEHYTYGGYINGNPKLCNLNQLEWIIKHFKKVGFGTEHCYISIGNGYDLLNYDEPYINDQDRKTTACLRGLDFRIIKENDINYLITVGYWRCLSGKTPILFKSNKELYRSTLSNLYKKFNNKDSIEVLSVDEILEPVWAKVYDTKKFYKENIKTINILGVGEIEVTEEHRFPIYENNKIVYKKTKDLKVGDFILEGKNIDIKNNKDEIDLVTLFRKKRNIFLYNLNLNDFKKIKTEGISFDPWHKDARKIPIFKVVNSSFIEEYKGKIKCVKIIKDRYFKVSEDFAYFMGVWISDGWFTKTSALRIAISDKKEHILNRILHFLENEFEYIPSIENRDGCVVLNIAIKFLHDFFECIGFQHGAKIKTFPTIIFNLNPNLIYSVLEGWIDGDGGTTTSKDLIIDTAYLCKIITENISIYKEKPRQCFFKKENRYFKSEGLYKAHILTNKNNGKGKLQSWKNCYLRKIQSINRIFKSGFVYDISIDSPTHLYYCGNTPILTHNSWDIIAFPENIGGIILLNEFISQELSIEPGPICFSSKSLHAYEHAFDYIKQRLGK